MSQAKGAATAESNQTAPSPTLTRASTEFKDLGDKLISDAHALAAFRAVMPM
jgi:hypothetical protein